MEVLPEMADALLEAFLDERWLLPEVEDMLPVCKSLETMELVAMISEVWQARERIDTGGNFSMARKDL